MLPRFELPFFGTIASHDLLVGVAIVVCVGLGLRWTIVREDLPPGRVLVAILLMMVLVLAGGRLHFAMTKWHFFEADPTKLFRLSSGGLHAPGAIACLTIGGWFVLRALRLPIGRFVDGMAQDKMACSPFRRPRPPSASPDLRPCPSTGTPSPNT